MLGVTVLKNKYKSFFILPFLKLQKGKLLRKNFHKDLCIVFGHNSRTDANAYI